MIKYAEKSSHHTSTTRSLFEIENYKGDLCLDLSEKRELRELVQKELGVVWKKV